MRELIEHQRGSVPENETSLRLRAALEQTLDRLGREGIDAYLMGGVGAAALAGSDWPGDRPLSLDLDFLIPGDEDTMRKMLALWKGGFVRNDAKPVFKSTKLLDASGASFKGAGDVELDFITESVVSLPEGRLSLSVTPELRDACKPGNMLGTEVLTLPASLIAAQKLFAGRGLEHGKYDLRDAQTLLESGLAKPEELALWVSRFGTPSELRGIADRIAASLAKLPGEARELEFRASLARLTVERSLGDGREGISRLLTPHSS